jgi:hypothetical protein
LLLQLVLGVLDPALTLLLETLPARLCEQVLSDQLPKPHPQFIHLSILLILAHTVAETT